MERVPWIVGEKSKWDVDVECGSGIWKWDVEVGSGSGMWE